jgi:uncharacterized UPF0160 family protein
MAQTELCRYAISYTHGGTFHFDDVLCTALLRIINPKIIIKRVMLQQDIVLSDDTIVYDIKPELCIEMTCSLHGRSALIKLTI